MSQRNRPDRSSRALLRSATGLVLAAVAGVLVALQLARRAEPTEPSKHWTGAYRPGQHRAWAEQSAGPAGASSPSASADAAADDTSTGVSGAASERGDGGDLYDDEALPPELEARLQAAARISTVAPPGAPPPPPPGSLPPESQIARQEAMVSWQRQVQLLLDRCVARPAELRKPTPLDVILTPPQRGSALAEQLLAPAAVSLPPDELRRLWRDTDPDALDQCLHEVRALALAITPLPGATARVMPASFERLVVSL